MPPSPRPERYNRLSPPDPLGFAPRTRPSRRWGLNVRLLGSFAVRIDGRPASGLATARLQSLFAYLTLHADAPQLRAQLAARLWPDAPEASGRNNLRQLLHQLRQALPEADRFIRKDAATLQWMAAPPFSLDVASFEAALAEAETAGRLRDASRRRACLERAVDACGGPLLPGCYDDWIGPLRERLARRCQAACSALIGMLEERREYAAALARVRHWLEHERAAEEAWRWLMRLLALTGDRAGALQAYRQCADALRRELDVEPSAATVRLNEMIRSAVEPAPRGGGDASARRTLPLVDREAEWARLREAWARAAAGQLTFCVVTGEAGLGKSRLAEELLDWAGRQGVPTAKTRCYAAEGRLSLAPVSDLLRSEAVAPHLPRLPDVWHLEVGRIVPELAASRPSLPQPAPMADFAGRLRFFEGLARAVLLAPRPLLLVIDDLQWCDRETIEWLHFFWRFDPAAALLVVGTARTDEIDPAHPLSGLLLELRGASQLVEIPLEPLDAAETARLAAQVAERGFDAAESTRLYRETQGNPLFVVETARAAPGANAGSAEPGRGVSGLPPRVHAVISARLAQLSDAAREAAAAAAVVGRAFDTDVLVRVMGDEDAVVGALDELWRRRIVREQGPNAYDFTHDRIRDVAYDDTSTPQRRRLHRRVAEALAERHAGQLDAVHGAIAAHYESAGLAEQAIPHYARAALVAQGIYAHEDAIGLAERGLSLVRRLAASAQRDTWELELQLALAPSCRVALGWASPVLRQVLERALALCVRVGTPQQRLQALFGLQSLSLVAGRLETSLRILDELVRVSGESDDAQPLDPALAMGAGTWIQLGRFEDACTEIDRLLGAAPRGVQGLQAMQGFDYEIHSRAWQSHALWCLGRPDTALARANEAVELARQRGQPFSHALAATYLALLQQLRAEAAVFRRHAEEALALATEFRATYYRTWAAVLVAYAETLPGSDPTAIARLRQAIVAFQETGARLRLPYYLSLLAAAHLRAGEAAAGLDAVAQGLADAQETGEHWWDSELRRLGAELLAATGQSGAAEAEVLVALETARRQGARSLELRAATTLAALHVRAGRPTDARDLLQPLCAAFREGIDTPDQQHARVLLSELR